MSPPRLSSGIDSSFWAQDDLPSPLAGLGARATATLRYAGPGGERWASMQPGVTRWGPASYCSTY